MAGTSEATELHPSLAHLNLIGRDALTAAHLRAEQFPLIYPLLYQFAESSDGFWYAGQPSDCLSAFKETLDDRPWEITHFLGAAPKDRGGATMFLELIENAEETVANLLLTPRPLTQTLQDGLEIGKEQSIFAHRYRARHSSSSPKGHFHDYGYPLNKVPVEDRELMRKIIWMKGVDLGITAMLMPRR